MYFEFETKIVNGISYIGITKHWTTYIKKEVSK